MQFYIINKSKTNFEPQHTRVECGKHYTQPLLQHCSLDSKRLMCFDNEHQTLYFRISNYMACSLTKQFYLSNKNCASKISFIIWIVQFNEFIFYFTRVRSILRMIVFPTHSINQGPKIDKIFYTIKTFGFTLIIVFPNS